MTSLISVFEISDVSELSTCILPVDDVYVANNASRYGFKHIFGNKRREMGKKIHSTTTFVGNGLCGHKKTASAQNHTETLSSIISSVVIICFGEGIE